MPFTSAEIANISNSLLDAYVDKGKLHVQNRQNKPMLDAFDRAAKQFAGGKEFVSIGVKPGKSGGSLQGYTHDDQVSYYNPTPARRINFAWREMFLGMGLTHTELKHGGITVNERGADQSTSNKDGREDFVLAELLTEKMDDFDEDYDVSLDLLVHGDGSSDAKAISGIRAFILDNPALGTTGGLDRTLNSWWRNIAATAAANSASTGFAPISSSPTNGGALIQFLQRQERQINRFAQGRRRSMKFAGSDFINAYEIELRANGQYAQTGWTAGGDGATDGYMQGVKWNGGEIIYDPTMDDLGLAKRMYDIDMSKIMLMYMQGEKKKVCNPARPHDRFVWYQGVTTTGLMVAKQLNTSAVYDIA